MRFTFVLLILGMAQGVYAHPMGNFSVNHYSGFEVTRDGVRLHYAIDLAEIPTLELLHRWNLQRDSPRAELEARASAEARKWLLNLRISLNGRAVRARFLSADLYIGDGAGNLPVARVSAKAFIEAQGGDLAYEDTNYPERAGWKEIVIDADSGVVLRRASQTGRDISHALTQYPPDPTVAPPQDLRAEMNWTVDRTISGTGKPDRTANSSGPAAIKEIAPPDAITEIAPVAQPHRAPAAAPPALSRQAAPAGTVVRGDFVSRLLAKREFTPWMMLVALCAAFGLGAAHALTPGHGKTIVAAYLVGSRGTIRHAALLGGVVTFTHTVSVFVLGIATLFLFQYIVPEKIAQALGVISGLSIVAVGAWMIRKRIRAARQVDVHHHDHAHGHSRSHANEHHHAHEHSHEHHGHVHTHSHSHMPEELSWSGLVALGVSGGLVPCESALVLMLSAIALGRVALGLLLLVSFSLGLASVLLLVGACVLYAKGLIPESRRTGNGPAMHWLPVVSAAVVIVIGLLMTGVSAGVIQPKWMLG